MTNLIKIMTPICLLLVPGLWITQGWTGEPNTKVGLPILFTTLSLITIFMAIAIIGTSPRPKTNKEPIRNKIRDMVDAIRSKFNI